ncbi:hypothetical protein ABZ565_19570 [Streptomyces sp. NPDC016469]|uniref:hypothetical protein n=1 Tax=Streptomyces sp. NPDC016469 TaxID=3157191 RepID=UPI0033F8A884
MTHTTRVRGNSRTGVADHWCVRLALSPGACPMDHSVPTHTQRRSTPAPYALLGGFVLLLSALFAVSYGAGRLAGPVAPDMRGVTHPDEPGSHDMGGMSGMGD